MKKCATIILIAFIPIIGYPRMGWTLNNYSVLYGALFRSNQYIHSLTLQKDFQSRVLRRKRYTGILLHADFIPNWQSYGVGGMYGPTNRVAISAI